MNTIKHSILDHEDDCNDIMSDMSLYSRLNSQARKIVHLGIQGETPNDMEVKVASKLLLDCLS